jgi:hypothetical protein
VGGRVQRPPRSHPGQLRAADLSRCPRHQARPALSAKPYLFARK